MSKVVQNVHSSSKRPQVSKSLSPTPKQKLKYQSSKLSSKFQEYSYKIAEEKQLYLTPDTQWLHKKDNNVISKAACLKIAVNFYILPLKNFHSPNYILQKTQLEAYNLYSLDFIVLVV